MDWVQGALRVAHPVDTSNPAQADTIQAIRANLDFPPKVLELKRKAAPLLKAAILPKQLECEETQLHASMPDWSHERKEGPLNEEAP